MRRDLGARLGMWIILRAGGSRVREGEGYERVGFGMEGSRNGRTEAGVYQWSQTFYPNLLLSCFILSLT